MMLTHFVNESSFYRIVCKSCCKQNVTSTTTFKERFRIHKTDNKTNKIRCGVANNL